jgi:xylulose-5-phosphate/fructose-6-phosphate phosphoketolase
MSGLAFWRIAVPFREIARILARLLGHWATSPDLNLVYVHLNRLINHYDLNVVYMAGPGHGGPALVAMFTSKGPT